MNKAEGTTEPSPCPFIQTGKGARHKYIFDGVSDFVNSSGESIASAIKNSRIVQDGLTKARYLIEKGWPWR